MDLRNLQVTEEIVKIEVIESLEKVQKNIFGNVLEAMKACGICGKVVVVNGMKYGIQTAPALVVNGIVLFAGKSQSTEEIIQLLQHNIPHFS
jgi:hypothetical protein